MSHLDISYMHINLITDVSWALILFYRRGMVTINVKKVPEAPKHLGVFLAFPKIFICPTTYHFYSQMSAF